MLFREKARTRQVIVWRPFQSGCISANEISSTDFSTWKLQESARQKFSRIDLITIGTHVCVRALGLKSYYFKAPSKKSIFVTDCFAIRSKAYNLRRLCAQGFESNRDSSSSKFQDFGKEQRLKRLNEFDDYSGKAVGMGADPKACCFVGEATSEL